MSDPHSESTVKISEQFRSRIEQLQPTDVVRAIVALRVTDDEDGKVAETRPREEQRRKRVQSVQAATASTFTELDETLKAEGGRRLQKKASAFGTVLVESSRAGILALVECPFVASILEDQGLSLPGTNDN